MSLKKLKGRLLPRDLPADAEPVEAEIIDAFDRWVHENHPNPQRIGCPGTLALAELVVADTKFDDDYTLNHISECARCVDELTELRVEFERMNQGSGETPNSPPARED